MTHADLRKPSVLVGIATFNRAVLLSKAIRAAQAQDYPSVRVAVVDDASTDSTPELALLYPEVSWLRWNPGRGYVEARNYMMRSFGGEYYASLDDDSWFLGTDELRLAVSYLEANPKVAAVAFDILSPDRPNPKPRSDPQPVPMYIGCGHLLRLSAARDAGYYVSNPGGYGGEEKDLCLRLLDAGWEVHLLPGVHVWHDKTFLSRDIGAQHRSGVCNDLSFALRRCPFPSILGVLPYKLASHLWVSMRHRRVKPYFAGIMDFLSNARMVWRCREPVRAATFWLFTRGFPGR